MFFVSCHLPTLMPSSLFLAPDSERQRCTYIHGGATKLLDFPDISTKKVTRPDKDVLEKTSANAKYSFSLASLCHVYDKPSHFFDFIPSDT